GDLTGPLEEPVPASERPGGGQTPQESRRAFEERRELGGDGGRVVGRIEPLDVVVPLHQPPASRRRRWSTRAATVRRYSAVDRTSSIGESSPARASAARSTTSGVGREPSRTASVAGARTGVAATDPRATRTSV